MLAELNDQRMEFLVNLNIAGQIALEKISQMLITIAARERYPLADSFRVSIDDENRLSRRIKQNRVSGFKTNPVHRKQIPAHGMQIAREKRIEILQPARYCL